MARVRTRIHQVLQNKWIRWGFVVGWMLLIFRFSAQNGDDSSSNNKFLVTLLKDVGIDIEQMIGDQVNFLIRKAAHMTEYFILMLVSYNALRGKWSETRTLLAGFTLTVVYAITDELHQAFVPGRACMVKDVVIDSAGALIAVGSLLLIHKRKKGRS